MQTTSRTSSQREPYPSDLTDAQWYQIEPSIPPEKDLGRHRSTDIREIVNGINYRWSTGCVWRMLPHDYPPWATVYTYFRRWQRDGTLREIREALIRRRTASQPLKGNSSLDPISCPHQAETEHPQGVLN